MRFRWSPVGTKKNMNLTRTFCVALPVVATTAAVGVLLGTKSNITAQVSGGHDTNPVDNGRPVILIANALGVPETVFREAFSHVRPAPGGEAPDPRQVDRNKEALLTPLGPYGVRNDRLDEVSNYYRYRPETGELWQHRDAQIRVSVVKGKAPQVTVEDAGAGYSSLPVITVPGHPEFRVSARLRFTRDLATNGSLEAVTIQVKK